MHDRLVSRRIDALHQCFLVSFGISGPIVVYLKTEFSHVYVRWRKQCCNLHYYL